MEAEGGPDVLGRRLARRRTCRAEAMAAAL